MSKAGATIEFRIREDGVYLILFRPPGVHVDRMDVSKKMKIAGVQDADPMAVEEALRAEGNVDIKISSNTELSPGEVVPEVATVNVSKDKMEAHIVFSRPDGGNRLNQEDIEKAIQQAGITFGLLEGIEQRLANNRDYDRDYLIAEGMPPIPGKDGYLDYHFDTQRKTLKPKVMEDGKVDFRALNLIEMASNGMVLVTAIPEEFGRDGMDVLGGIVAQPKLKPAPKLVAGKGTELSEDGTKLLSKTAGQIIFDGKKVVVNPVLEVAGDVGAATGNIDFVGSVVVKGNVISGFRVVAEGDIDVQGVVEAAYIRSAGNVNIARGVQGMEKAEIIATGDVSLKFAENCSVKAGKNIYAEAVLHSKVRCGRRLELAGKSAYLVGGDINVREAVVARTIGSSMGTTTNIHVGLDPDAFDEYNGYVREYNQLKTEHDKITNAARNMKELHEKGGLSEHKKSLFLRLLHQQSQFRQKMMAIKSDIDRLSEMLSGMSGSITASDRIRAGVKATIGNASMHIHDDIKACVLRNADGVVIVGNYKGE